MHGIDILPAKSEDIEELLKIEKLSFPTCWLKDFLEREFHRPVVRVWLARQTSESAQTVGYLAAVRVGRELHLLQIASHPQQRRKGVATALLSHALDVEVDVKSVVLEVRESNRAAMGFYEKMGFGKIGRGKSYYSDTGEDALYLARILS